MAARNPELGDASGSPVFMGKITDTPDDRAKLRRAIIEPVGERGVSAAVTHTVTVRLAADEEFRALYGPTWADDAELRVETADDKLFTNWGINFSVTEVVPWLDTIDGVRNLCTQIWPEVTGEVGFNGKDVVVMFIKNPWNGPSAGCSTGNKFIVGYQGPTQDWKVSRHEMSHLYGNDDASGAGHPNDIMEDPYNFPSSWCSHEDWEHYDTMTFNAGKDD